MTCRTSISPTSKPPARGTRPTSSLIDCLRGKVSQRVYEKPRLLGFQTPEHQTDHGDVDHGLTGLRLPLVVLAQPPVPAQPGERPLHDPAPLDHLERLALFLLRLRDNLQQPAPELHGPLGDPAVVDPIGEDLHQPGEAPLD